ncbi:polysaccharide pyruvyl transferase family protein [Georgenia sp. MJ206]|uniref:polysaccharide pyruvyl transferase family protein n=1 Tax=Georgenia wangjunii TaxID=3117730 RepID=UPI002F266BDD
MPHPGPEASTVYLVGVAGNPNLGDELIVAAWLRYLADHLPDADVWLDTPYPGPASALLAGIHPRLHVTDTLFRLRDRAVEDGVDAADAAGIGAYMTRALADPGNTPWWTSGIDLVRGADVVHLVGGGYANDLWPHNLALLDALAWLAQHTPARVGATGLGLLPLGEASAARVADAAQHFAVLDVRDTGTARALLGGARPTLPLRLTSDDLFVQAADDFLDAEGGAAFDVGVVVQHDLRSMDWPDLLAFVRAQVTAWDVDPSRVAVIECIPRLDATVYDDLSAHWPGLQLRSFHEVWRDGFPAAAHQRWISTRFHPHLLAAGAGARGVAISVRGDYYDAKHGLVLAAGSRWELLSDLRAPVASDLAYGNLRERWPALRARKRETAAILYGPPRRP